MARCSGVVWDLLACFDLEIIRTSKGFGCALCEADDTPHGSVDAIWTSHVFEPFLSWYRDHLCQAVTLELTGCVSDGLTMARLKRSSDKPHGGQHHNTHKNLLSIPLWLN